MSYVPWGTAAFLDPEFTLVGAGPGAAAALPPVGLAAAGADSAGTELPQPIVGNVTSEKK